MGKVKEVQMPEDWNDHLGWNTYYESRLALPEQDRWNDSTGSIGIDQLPQFAEHLKLSGRDRIWVPGCGLSPLARLLASLGLKVVATDLSPVAVDFQSRGLVELAGLASGLGEPDANGSFTAELHDFREEFVGEVFDVILNVKAFQAFPVPDMERIAYVHATALRKGGYAYFDTMNVQGTRRDQLEQALENGGFVVPLIRLNRWYREALAQTGIPHAFVLGMPMIPRTGAYANGGAKWDRDMLRLKEITTEYRSRFQAEQQAEESRIGPDSKVAHVIYSTG